MMSSYPVPKGMTLISDSDHKPLLMEWEAQYRRNNFSYFFSPRTIFSLPLIESIVDFKIPPIGEDGFVFANVTLVNNSVFLGIRSYPFNYSKLPRLYRKLNGNITGSSSTTVKQNFAQLKVFEPLSPFCTINKYSFKTTCLNTGFFTIPNGSLIHIMGTNCTYSYQFICEFLQWSKYPPNPDRGFVLGSSIIELNESFVLFGNNEIIRLPTPDFSMIYNTPTLVLMVFSTLTALSFKLRYESLSKGTKKDKVKSN